MDPRFFEIRSENLKFSWNKISDKDWAKIRKLFVSSFVDNYQAADGEDLQIQPETKLSMHSLWEAACQEPLNQDQRVMDLEVMSAFRFYLDPVLNKIKANQNPYELLQQKVCELTTSDHALLIKWLTLQHHFELVFSRERDFFQADTRAKDFLIARFHDEPIGLYICEWNHKSGYVYVRYIATHPSFQGTGLADLMMKQVMNHYPCAIGIELCVSKANARANRFYDRLHFTEGMVFDCDKPKWDATASSSMHVPDDDPLPPEHFLGRRLRRS